MVSSSPRLFQSVFEIVKIDRLGQKVERAAVHGGADIRHVVVRGDDHRLQEPGVADWARSVRPSITGMLMSVKTM